MTDRTLLKGKEIICRWMGGKKARTKGLGMSCRDGLSMLGLGLRCRSLGWERGAVAKVVTVVLVHQCYASTGRCRW